MRLKAAYRVGLMMLGLTLAGPAGLCGPYAPEYPETKQLMLFVRSVAERVQHEEGAAFDAFRENGGPWFRGELYVFVLDMQGLVYCLPPQRELEGQNLLGLKDVNGKLFVQAHLRAVASAGGAGWSHYMWPRPGETVPSWKSSYLVRVTARSGKEYVVGAGVYPTRTEPMFVVAAVDGAAALLQRQGEAAFGSLRDRAGDFLFGDVYVFVLRWDGTAVVHPASPELEGQNLMALKDRSGKLFVREMFRQLEASETGWVDYLWPRPGATEPSLKSSYVRKVQIDGRPYLVGSGVYRVATPSQGN